MRVTDREPRQRSLFRSSMLLGVLCTPAYAAGVRNSINWRAMGRKSLDATKVRFSLCVRACEAFVRGLRLLAEADFFFEVLEDVVLLLLVEVELAC